MKHLLLILTIIFGSLCTLPAMAQKAGKSNEQRALHMSQILGLNDQTSSKFTVVYEQYRQEMQTARQKHPRIKAEKGKNGEGKARLTDEQVKKNIENSFALSQSILDIRKKYYKEFLKILTPRQIERMYELEKKDGEKLREMAKKHRKKH